MTKTTLNQNPNLQPPKDSVSPRQIISAHGLPPTSHRRVLKMRAAPPTILSSRLVDWETAKELFDIFFKYVSPFLSVLNPVLHTVRNVYDRDPFLLTVSTAFIDGVKSVEMAQAHLHMSGHGLPARRNGASGDRVAVVTKFVEVLASPRASITKRHAEATRQILAWIAKVRNCHGAPWVPVLLVQKQQQQQYLRGGSLLTWSFTTSTGDHISLVADLVQAYSCPFLRQMQSSVEPGTGGRAFRLKRVRRRARDL
ncbi:hypothetical protein BU17DRAFT_68075 [Hysterangium stoloniferum]|nr:hypothetical protein BU17DRAFT_68075 [Hysterangium stoloniferum]